MEKITLLEQDIINAICLCMSEKKRMRPEELEVELSFDDEAYGFSAEIFFNNRNQILSHRDMIDCLRHYIQNTMQSNYYYGIELVLDDEEGIIAVLTK